MDIKAISDFILSQPEGTKVYIGCDSERVKRKGIWYADFISVVVVHIAGKHGCKVFGSVDRQRDYDKKLSKPRMRLMTEVYKASELYLQLAPELDGIDIEVHLDINPDTVYGSSCVINEAVGYIRGTCNVVPLIKPEAWAASTCADRFKEYIA